MDRQFMAIKTMMRMIRESYRASVRAWVKDDYQLMIALLKQAMKNTHALIEYIQKIEREKHGGSKQSSDKISS